MSEEESRVPTLSISINEKEVLYAVYMQFLKNGGLFIPTIKKFKMGDRVQMKLAILDVGKFEVQGKVVWITPKNTSGNRSPGIGVSFELDEGKKVKDLIEKQLVGMLDSGKPTHTL